MGKKYRLHGFCYRLLSPAAPPGCPFSVAAAVALVASPAPLSAQTPFTNSRERLRYLFQSILR